MNYDFGNQTVGNPFGNINPPPIPNSDGFQEPTSTGFGEPPPLPEYSANEQEVIPEEPSYEREERLQREAEQLMIEQGGPNPNSDWPNAMYNLSIALTRFTGTPVDEGVLASWYDIDIKDAGTKFQLQMFVNMERGSEREGWYTIVVSDYLSKITNKRFETAEHDHALQQLQNIADELNRVYRYVKELQALIGQIAEQHDDIGLTVTPNYAGSHYIIYGNEKATHTNDPEEAVNIISKYIHSYTVRFIDEMNEKLQGISKSRIVYGENIEVYRDGFFFSTFYRADNNFTLTFHPGPDPITWVQKTGSGRRHLNAELEGIVRRIK